jgi:hypothetical protein
MTGVTGSREGLGSWLPGTPWPDDIRHPGVATSVTSARFVTALGSPGPSANSGFRGRGFMRPIQSDLSEPSSTETTHQSKPPIRPIVELAALVRL